MQSISIRFFVFLFSLFIVQAITHDESCGASSYGNLVDYLLNSTKDLFAQTLETKIISGIKNGNLHPDDYFTYIFQDIIYLKFTAEFYKNYRLQVERQSSNSSKALKNITAVIDSSYNSFYNSTLKQYKINRESADLLKQVHGIKVIRKYLSDLEDILQSKEPVYLIISAYACLKLYDSTARTISNATSATTNLYNFWIESNMDGNTWRKIELFLNENWCIFNQSTSLSVFRNSLSNEIDLFNLIDS